MHGQSCTARRRRLYESILHIFLCEITQRYDLAEHGLFEISKHFGESDECWIAGGAVRAMMSNVPITSDVDFFFKSEEPFDRFIAKHSPAVTEHHITFNARSGEQTYKIQAIKIANYGTVEECLDSFDFTICQLAVYGGKVFAGQYTICDLGRKRLALHKLTYGAATVRRLLKYSRQEFTACQHCIVSLLRAVGENPSVINSDIQYVD